jgi:hypothetical protein
VTARWRFKGDEVDDPPICSRVEGDTPVIPIPKLELSAATLKLIIAIGCVALLALLVQDRNRWKAKTSHYAELLAGERAVHSANIANIRAAAEQARRADAANAARVRADQAAINERSLDDYESRIAAARAAAQRLRRGNETAAADHGDRRATAMPGLPAAARDLAQAADEDRLPESDALIATEQAIQLDELIKWVRRQAAVPVNGDPD